MDIIEILEFATKKHSGQVDKSNIPYILHPVRVAFRLDKMDERIVALLHDILEDTDATIEELKELGLTDVMIDAIMLLTRPKDMTYMEYIKRLADNSLACKVKLADLEDNMDPERIKNAGENYGSLLERYKKAYKYLKLKEDEL